MVDAAVQDHLTKKRKKAAPIAVTTTPQAGPSKPGPSTARLFQPFRALGYVTNHVPFAMFVHTPRGALAKPTINIVTSVGKSWMMWNADKITLLFVGKESHGEIRSLVMNGTSVFASAGDRVTKYERGQEVFRWVAPGQPQLGQIQLFGDQLLALKEDGTGLVVFDHVKRRVEHIIDFHSSFTATTLLHPATYLNKVLIGSKQGELQLWNTRTCTLIHTYPQPELATPSAVTALAQSPAVDVIGVGYADGTIRVFDIKLAELVMQMKMDEGGVTQLSFRMDGPGILASGSTAGTFAVWDLSKGGRMIHVQRGAHEQAVTGLQFVQGQPLLVTSSGDNNIKQWLFESPTSVPSLLKFRGGHHAPPAHIRYYGDNGKQLLTAGKDRALRVTSVVRDSRSHELSQGQSIMKKALGMGLSADDLKLPPITAMSSSHTRSRQWEDVLTVHAEDNVARTWKANDSRIGAWTFQMDDGVVQSACVTACGNFGLAGSSAGEIKMWNMQSGKERRSFALSGAVKGDTKPKIVSASKFAKPKDAEKEKSKAPVRSIKAITGLVTDALNTVVIASTLEGKIYFFDFHNTRLLHEMQVPSSITQIDLCRDNGLLSVVCDDLAVRMVDIETRRVVRDLRGFKGRILDTAFSHDSRWLIATSLDSVIRTYDIPTGRLVDAFKTSSICTSIAFSPSGDFLATAHVDSLGVHLWANRAQFMDVALKHIDEDREIMEIALPSIHGSQGNDGFGELKKIGAPEFTDIYTTPDQLSEGLMTMSLLPRSRWQTLLNLETIKLRNKPKEPPKAPEAAPFFLPTVSGLETRFDLSAANPENEDTTKRLAPLQMLESDFTRRLAVEDASGDYTAFFEYAKALSPAALDLEIRSLVSLDHMSAFIHALSSRLTSHKDFEAVQALMSVFLSVHSDVLIANEELINGLRNLREQQKKETQRLRELVGYALGTLGFLRSSA